MNIQLEFDAIAHLLTDCHAPMRRRTATAKPAPTLDAIALNRILTASNVTFASYAVMLAIHSSTEATTRSVADAIGYTLHAVRNQVRRTPWFHKPCWRDPHIEFSEDGRRKFQAIQDRITREIRTSSIRSHV